MLLFCLYTAECALLLVGLGLFRAAAKPSLLDFLHSTGGLVTIGAAMIGCAAWVLVYRGVQRADPKRRRLHVVTVGLNLFTLVLVGGAAEVMIRALSIETPEGPRFGNVLLFPRRWEEVVSRHRAVIDKMAEGGAYVVYDPDLGWTLAPHHQDASGLYATSAEGARSPEVRWVFGDPGTRLTGRVDEPVRLRVALVGDSMTFGSEVPCRDSWPHLLQARMGAQVQIMNFGVPGYSAAQAWQRYQRDVRSWRPDVVIMGVTSRQLLRLMNVYNFLISPLGTQFPFARPRMVWQDGRLTVLNRPVPSPQEIFGHARLSDLPFLEQDRSYARLEWERSGLWSWLQRSYLFRWMTSIRPPVEPVRAGLGDAVLEELTENVLSAFVRDVRQDGAIPLVVHLPYQGELRASAGAESVIPLGLRLLKQTGLEVLDATPCLIRARAFDAYAPGDHYLRAANEAVADCVAGVLPRLDPSR